MAVKYLRLKNIQHELDELKRKEIEAMNKALR
jgi:hypothetical protein